MRLFSLLLALCVMCAPARAQTLTVFAAASLSDVMQAIADELRETEGFDIRHSFASSSVLARQIMAGAPADIFISANTAWMDEVERQGFAEAGTRTDITGNRLALVAPQGRQPAEAFDLSQLGAMLGGRDHIATGDPDHVPAGIYARQALETLGIWDALAPRLARSDNVRGALALVARGEVPFGIVYASDAPASRDVQTITLFPADLHDPIHYPAIIINGRASSASRAYLAFLTSEKGQALFARFGFAPLPKVSS